MYMYMILQFDHKREFNQAESGQYKWDTHSICNETDEVILTQTEAETLLITCILFLWEIVEMRSYKSYVIRRRNP